MQQGILLDLTPLVTPSTLRGIGRYVRGLCEGLFQLGGNSEFSVLGLTADNTVARLSVASDLIEQARAPAVTPVKRSLQKRNRLILFEAPRLAKETRHTLHLTDPVGFPVSGRGGHCLTCHDLIPIILREYTGRMPGVLRGKIAMERLRYRRARRILAVSHATKRDLCERLSIEPEKVDVVWHGVDHVRFQPKPDEGERERIEALLGGPQPYVLYVGAGDPRKDLDTLLTAFARSRLRTEAVIAIAGAIGQKRSAGLVARAKSLGVSERLKLLGYVDESLVPGLYRQASLHVFASRYEGFGLPVLEALAAGCPTITSPDSSLDEVAGDAAMIVPCGEPEALTSALEALFFDSKKRAELRALGLSRAATFTWRACAQQTLEFWQRALAT